MTIELNSSFGSILPYWTFALAAAASFYGGMIWLGKHLRLEFRNELSNWLNGYFESTWTLQFCRMFDSVFGNKTVSLKRFARSSIASICAVLVLYVLFAHVLGVMGTRISGQVNLWQALLIGAAINVIPDFLSLIETRWLLKQFVRVRSFFGQAALLLADLVFTSVIIFIAIAVYQMVFGDGQIPSPIAVVALFSIFAVFFYSTFLTSVWAWIYCLSTWFVRIFARLKLSRILDVNDNPIKQIALVGAIIIVLGGMLFGPIFKPEKGGFATAFDVFVCSFDSEVCFHAARAAKDHKLTVQFMEQACGVDNDGNCEERLTRFLRNDPKLSGAIWQRACDGGYARACRAIANHYRFGRFGSGRDAALAVKMFRKGCAGDDAESCNHLGDMHANGVGLSKNLNRARHLYQVACDGRFAAACTNLGWIYETGNGAQSNPGEAATYYKMGCTHGDATGCFKLGFLYEAGKGVQSDPDKATEFYQKACAAGEATVCNHLKYLKDKEIKKPRIRPLGPVSKVERV